MGGHRTLVVGAVVVDSLDRPTTVLAARRTRPTELAGYWEFPGGKVEPGEAPRAALLREVAEELDVAVTVGDELPGPPGGWPISADLTLRLFLAEVAGGKVRPGTDHDEVRWLTSDTLDAVEWLPSDRAAVAVLRELLVGGDGRTEHGA